MRRRAFGLFVRALVVSLALLQAGTATAFVGARCVDECEDDDGEGRCAPTCDDCACCARPPILSAPTFATLLVAAEPRPLANGEPRVMQAEVAWRVFRPPRLDVSRGRS